MALQMPEPDAAILFRVFQTLLPDANASTPNGTYNSLSTFARAFRPANKYLHNRQRGRPSHITRNSANISLGQSNYPRAIRGSKDIHAERAFSRFQVAFDLKRLPTLFSRQRHGAGILPAALVDGSLSHFLTGRQRNPATKHRAPALHITIFRFFNNGCANRR